MFAYLFSTAIEIIVGIGILILVYQVFLSDMIKAKRQQVKDSEAKHDSIEKIAKVKLVSDDPKDIEKFITDNAQYLSDDMVQRLVDRIDNIKNDNVINADTLLKKRIDALEPELEVHDEPAVLKRASRKR